jgi:predicted DNA-binding protein
VVRHADPITSEVTIRVDADVRRRLRALATRSRRTQEQVILAAIDAYLDRNEGFRLPPWVGAWTPTASGSGRNP